MAESAAEMAEEEDSPGRRRGEGEEEEGGGGGEGDVEVDRPGIEVKIDDHEKATVGVT